MSQDRYDTTDHPEAQYEPGSNDSVLKNKLGIQNTDEMDEVELDLLIQLYDLIPEEIEADQPLTITDIAIGIAAGWAISTPVPDRTGQST